MNLADKSTINWCFSFGNLGIIFHRIGAQHILHFSEILSEIHTFSFLIMHLKMLYAKWRLFHLSLNELIAHLLWWLQHKSEENG